MELRRLLGLLSSGGETAAVEPQPGLDRVGDLIDDLTAAGLEVDAELEPVGALSPGIDLTAYRVLQEGLTNALRHSDGRAGVSVRVEGSALCLEVRNRRGSEAPAVPGAGRGLAGMRERVRLFGGDLSAAPDGDGFVLSARLPLDGGAG